MYNNKKRISSLLIAFVIAFVSYVPAFAGSSEITVNVDGRQLAFDVQPTIIGDRTMVPLRAIFEALGATVEWNPNTRGITGSKDGTVIQLTVDRTKAFVNSKEITLDVAATIIDGRTLVPVRFISESLGAQVEWVAATRTVNIASAENPAAFKCIAGVTVDSSYYDKLVNRLTSFTPYIPIADKIYRNQYFWIPVGFVMGEAGEAAGYDIVYDVTIYFPNGTVSDSISDQSVSGVLAPGYDTVVSKLGVAFYYTEAEPLGEYTVEVKATDKVANITSVSTSKVILEDYKNDISHFNNMDEVYDFIGEYNIDPEPEKLISAFLTYCKDGNDDFMVDVFLGEAFVKNKYLYPYLQKEIDKLKGDVKTRAAAKWDIIKDIDFKYEKVPGISGVYDYGIPNNPYDGFALWGQFFATGSTLPVVNLVNGLDEENFTEYYRAEHPNYIDDFQSNLIYDSYFRAYCEYLFTTDYLEEDGKQVLGSLLQKES